MNQWLQSAPKRLLFTGATGGVGSSLLFELLSHGFRVTCLVRPKLGLSGYERMKKQVGIVPPNLSVVEGDVTFPLCGVSSENRNRLKGNVDIILHGAGEVDFEEKNVEKIYRVNHGGTVNTLNLADFLEISDFRHISTAYVGGDSTNFGEDDFEKGQSPRNAYEEAKWVGEKEVRDQKNRSSERRTMIFRLGIVVGSSKTGVTTTFDAYYGFFHFLYRMHKKRMRNHPEFPGLPLAINCSEISTINLVPSNWCNEMIMELLKNPADDKTYHIVDENPKRVLWVIEESLKHLGISGVCLGEGNLPNSDDARNVQAYFDRFVGSLFNPYIRGEPHFSTWNIRATLKERYVKAPEITSDLLRRLLDFVRTRWDKEGGVQKANPSIVKSEVA